MKVAIVSDVHLEFGDWYPSNPESADVLILGGDILVASYVNYKMNIYSDRFVTFLENCKKEYKDVIYIMGNHEHYDGDFAKSARILSKICEDLGVHFLDKKSVKIQDVHFVGATLWTDMNREDHFTMKEVTRYMNDYRKIENSNRIVHFRDSDGKRHSRPAIFSPQDSVEDHKLFLSYIDQCIKENPSDTFVVVGHHAPSKISTKPQYEKDYYVNGAYSSDLSEFILDRRQIKLWTHGHTHHEFDYMIGTTRIVCNPRGYVGYERGSDVTDPYLAKVVEV